MFGTGACSRLPRSSTCLRKTSARFSASRSTIRRTPNIYVAATSVFGLNIVSRGRDGLPERRKKGGPGAGWMKGQFGLDLQGGPGGIYKIDGRTGVATLFANVTLDGVPNPGPGLGNLAYDAAHKQLFVSDLYTGMIHRFDLDGKDLGSYDHGVTGLAAAKLAAVPFNPSNRPNIASERFDTEKPDTWGFAPAARRVWGLAVHEGRLYYSVVSGPQIWSVGIERDGGFAADPRWELDVPAQAGPLPVSDIAFSQKGAMILAQRALIAGAYDYSAFTRPGEPQVFRVWLKGPNDPPSPGRWKLVPEEYAVGFAGNYRNTNGGVALGYGYGADGTLSANACEFSLWTTGQNLRNAPPLKTRLDPGGPLVVHGLAGVPASPVRNFNEPPWTSYAVDYDDAFGDPRAAGHLGSVRIYSKPCAAPAVYSGPGYPANPPYITGECNDRRPAAARSLHCTELPAAAVEDTVRPGDREGRRSQSQQSLRPLQFYPRGAQSWPGNRRPADHHGDRRRPGRDDFHQCHLIELDLRSEPGPTDTGGRHADLHLYRQFPDRDQSGSRLDHHRRHRRQRAVHKLRQPRPARQRSVERQGLRHGGETTGRRAERRKKRSCTTARSCCPRRIIR